MNETDTTEQQIFEAAKRVFQREGYAGARMQAIADEAEINKSMLHYYYRSKDRLFQAVFQDSVRQFFPVVKEVLEADLGIVPKVEKLVETYHGIFRENPHLPRFVVHEMNQHPDRFRAFMKGRVAGVPDPFIRQLEAEAREGGLDSVRPREFLVNIISLCVFPFVARNMIEVIFGMEGEEFDRFIEQRKKSLSTSILNTLKQ